MNWTAACLDSYNRPPQEQLAILHSSGGITIAAYCLSAATGCIALLRWRNIDDEDRVNLWRLYGWLTGLICFASCAGIVHVAAMIVFFEGLYKRPDQSSDNRILEATASIFLVGVRVSHVLMLAVDRMRDFAILSAPSQQSMKLMLMASSRWILSVIVVGLALEFSAAVSQVVFFFQIQNLNRTDDSETHKVTLKNLIGSFTIAQTLQYVTEIFVLCIMIFQLMVLCSICIHVIRLSISMVERSINRDGLVESGKILGLKIIGITCIGLFSFSLQLVYVTIQLQALQGIQTACDSCDPCSREYSIHSWLMYTPEFHFVIHLLSTALLMPLILWFLTSEKLLQAMRAKHVTRRPQHMQVLLHQ